MSLTSVAASGNALATGLPSSALGGLAELGLVVVSVSALVCITILVSKVVKDSNPDTKYLGLFISISVYSTLTIPWLFDPELDLTTLIIVGLNYFFWLTSIAIAHKGIPRRLMLAGAITLLTFCLLSNSTILSLKSL